MNLDLFTKVVAIGEIIIQSTKEKVRDKIPPVLYATFILGVVSMLGVVYDVIFNAPMVDSKYVFTSIGFVLLCILIPNVGFDKVQEIINLIKDKVK